MSYLNEIWIGELPDHKGFNWDIKGVPDDDYLQRADMCNEYLERLESIRDFYLGWAFDIIDIPPGGCLSKANIR